VFQGCQQWFCDPTSKTCRLNTLSNCGQTAGGACNAGIVVTQELLPPVDKDFLQPDGVDFREVGSIAITVKNTTAKKLYLDEVPLTLEIGGGGSQFDVTAVKMYQNFGGADWETPGDFYVTLTGNPFFGGINGKVASGAVSNASGINAGGTQRFVISLAFAKDKTFLAGRSYRLKILSTAGFKLVESFNGPVYAGTICGVPNAGFTGAWVNAKK
jgi:hypothetical protein